MTMKIRPSGSLAIPSFATRSLAQYILAGSQFTFDSATADADPGAGTMRANNASLAAATKLFVDDLDLRGADVSDWLDTLDDEGTAVNHGQIAISLASNEQVVAFLKVTGAVLDSSGYREIPVAYIGPASPPAFAGERVIISRLGGGPGADGTEPGILLEADDGTADDDPGVGKIRADNVDLSAASFLYPSAFNRAGSSIAAYLLGLDDSTNPTKKARVILTRVSDGKQATFDLSAVTSGTDYKKLAISNFDGTADLLQTAGEAISLQAEPVGDRGGPGASGASRFMPVHLVDSTGLDPTTDYAAGNTLDGKTIGAGWFILRAAPGGAVENGVYVAPVSGAASRHGDFDADGDLPGAWFSVMMGDEYGETVWQCTTDPVITLDTDPVAIEKVARLSEQPFLQARRDSSSGDQTIPASGPSTPIAIDRVDFDKSGGTIFVDIEEHYVRPLIPGIYEFWVNPYWTDANAVADEGLRLVYRIDDVDNGLFQCQRAGTSGQSARVSIPSTPRIAEFNGAQILEPCVHKYGAGDGQLEASFSTSCLVVKRLYKNPAADFALGGKFLAQTGSSEDITVPLGALAGDLILIFNWAIGGAPADVTPGGFTKLKSDDGGDARGSVFAKIADSDDAESVVTGLAGTTSQEWIIVVARTTQTPAGFADNSGNVHVGSGAPGIDIIAASGEANLPILCYCMYAADNAVSPRTSSETMTEIAGPSTRLYAKLLIYEAGDTPADISVQMEDEGAANGQVSGYLDFS